MSRLFRLWEKKRGGRSTGSQLVGGVGEALFFAALFLLGSASLAAVVATQANPAAVAAPQLEGFGLWLVCLVLASFILIGGVGFFYTVLQVGASAERRSALAGRASRIDLLQQRDDDVDSFPTIPHDANLTNSPGIVLAFRLPIAQPGNWQLAASAIFCLAWNGISAVLVVLAINSHLAGKPEWFLSLFAVPFLLIGVGSAYYFLRQLLMSTGIGPTTVEISEHPLRPGGVYTLFLSQMGHLKFRSLVVRLVCDEQASYRQGTDVRTETARMFDEQVFRKDDFQVNPGLPFEQQCELRLPAGGMHSFQSRHNSVQWKVVVQGQVEGWPSFERSFPVVVHPARPELVRP